MCTVNECHCKSIVYYKKCDMKPFLEEIYFIIFYECGKVEIKTEYFYYYSNQLKRKSVAQNTYIDFDSDNLYKVLNAFRLEHDIIKNDSVFNLFCVVINDREIDTNIYRLACKLFQSAKL